MPAVQSYPLFTPEIYFKCEGCKNETSGSENCMDHDTKRKKVRVRYSVQKASADEVSVKDARNWAVTDWENTVECKDTWQFRYNYYKYEKLPCYKGRYVNAYDAPKNMITLFDKNRATAPGWYKFFAKAYISSTNIGSSRSKWGYYSNFFRIVPRCAGWLPFPSPQSGEKPAMPPTLIILDSHPKMADVTRPAVDDEMCATVKKKKEEIFREIDIEPLDGMLSATEVVKFLDYNNMESAYVNYLDKSGKFQDVSIQDFMRYEFAGCSLGARVTEEEVDPASEEIQVKVKSSAMPSSSWNAKKECKDSEAKTIVEMSINSGFLDAPFEVWGNSMLCVYVDGRLQDWLTAKGDFEYQLSAYSDKTFIRESGKNVSLFDDVELAGISGGDDGDEDDDDDDVSLADDDVTAEEEGNTKAKKKDEDDDCEDAEDKDMCEKDKKRQEEASTEDPSQESMMADSGVETSSSSSSLGGEKKTVGLPKGYVNSKTRTLLAFPDRKSVV